MRRSSLWRVDGDLFGSQHRSDETAYVVADNVAEACERFEEWARDMDRGFRRVAITSIKLTHDPVILL